MRNSLRILIIGILHKQFDILLTSFGLSPIDKLSQLLVIEKGDHLAAVPPLDALPLQILNIPHKALSLLGDLPGVREPGLLHILI